MAEDRRCLPPEAAVTVTSFDDFYRLHRPEIARSLALVLGDSDLGYEATDEAMSRAFKQWDRVHAYANPQGWVFRVGLNWSRSLIRRRKLGRAKDHLSQAWHQGKERPPDLDLERAINGLSADHRTVVVLRFYSDWTVAQIADSLEIPAGTVKSRLNRALGLLQTELRPMEEQR